MSLLIAFNLYKSLFPIKASYNNIYEFMLRNHVLRLRFFLVVTVVGSVEDTVLRRASHLS